MPELRWTLLILGALFVAVLAWWELRRQRQARGGSGQQRAAWDSAADADRADHRLAVKDVPLGASRTVHDPPLTLPEIRAREPAHEIPVVEIADESMIGLRIDGGRIEEELDEEPEPAPAEPIVPAATPRQAPPELPPVPDDLVVRQPIVEWPPEESRQIVALRLVARAGERFPGRGLRQALAAEGFVLGKYAIFHKAGPDQRVVVSAASLTKPGTFDLGTMDSHRFAGLSLFTVLPGPLPPRQAFEELLSCARNLNVRLGGALQDERGEPLTPTRVASIRESLVSGTEKEAEQPS